MGTGSKLKNAKKMFYGGWVKDFEESGVQIWRKYVYGPPGTGPEASGGLRRSKIGVLGSRGSGGVSRVLFQACPMAPVDPFLGWILTYTGPMPLLVYLGPILLCL